MRIYRIVHIENLPQLLAQGKLWCGNQIAAQGLSSSSIGNMDLTRSRSAKFVPCEPGGSLNDYVPFYFCPRFVMLYLISKRHEATYGGGQEPIVPLISTLETVSKAGRPFVFTDRHTYLSTATFYNDAAMLTELDIAVIRSRDWQKTEEDPNRQERKMAEFLAHDFVSWECIQGIGVFSQSYKEDAEAILNRYNSRTPVQIKQEWYY